MDGLSSKWEQKGVGVRGDKKMYIENYNKRNGKEKQVVRENC
jgi:hypothetical protein